MKATSIFLTCAALNLGLTLNAQITYVSPGSPNNSGFVIEKFGDASPQPWYAQAMTSYDSDNQNSAVNGIRIQGFDFSLAGMYDNIFPLSKDMHVFDMCTGTAGYERTYLTTGYAEINGINEMFILQIDGTTGNYFNARHYRFANQFKDWHVQALSIIPNENGYAVSGFISRRYPTPDDVNDPGQAYEIFVATFDRGLNPIWARLIDYRITTPHTRDMGMHITEVRGYGYHVTGACESNMPGKYEFVLNILYDYNGNLVWDRSFIDWANEKAEVGQFAIYDRERDRIFLLSHKAATRTMGVYEIDPGSGIVLNGAHYTDQSGRIWDTYGLRLERSQLRDELLITGYITDGDPGTFPTIPLGGMPVFTTSIDINNLTSGTPGGTVLISYDVPNEGYRFFNFSQNKLANSNPGLNIPSSIGYSPQMSMIGLQPENNFNYITSPRDFMSPGTAFHPHVSKHGGYYEDECWMMGFDMRYDPIHVEYTHHIARYEDDLKDTYWADMKRYDSKKYYCFDQARESNVMEDAPVLTTEGRIYPSLVRDAQATLYLEFTNADAREVEISIYDASGRLTQQLTKPAAKGFNRIEIQAGNLAKGLNLVRVSGLETEMIQKIIRE